MLWDEFEQHGSVANFEENQSSHLKPYSYLKDTQGVPPPNATGPSNVSKQSSQVMFASFIYMAAGCNRDTWYDIMYQDSSSKTTLSSLRCTMKPYLEWVDRLVPLPRCYKIPYFVELRLFPLPMIVTCHPSVVSIVDVDESNDDLADSMVDNMAGG